MNQKMPVCMSIALALALSLVAPHSTGETAEETLDRFMLFSNCSPVTLVVERLHSDASKIGLTKESLEIAVESRLRSARLYSPELLTPRLYLNVSTVDSAFSISLEYSKLLYDDFTNSSNLATTWDTGSTGTHGGDASYVLSVVSEAVDRFLVEFLRVNEEACA